MPTRDLELFLRQLATLSQAGVPMSQGLRALAPQVPAPFNRVATAIAGDLADGHTLRAAADRHRQFDRATLSLISVGEHSGRLAAMLNHAAALVAKRRAILNQLTAKLAYPVLLYHLIFIIPSLGKWLFPDAQFIPAWFILGLLPLWLIIGSVVMLNRLRRRSIPLDTLTMRLPLIGSVLKAGAAINFSRCLQAFLLAGANLREAVLDCAPATGSPSAVADLTVAKQRIADGDTLAGALAYCRFLPPATLSLIATGEQSGALVEMLDKNVQLLDEEFTRKITLLTVILNGTIFALAVLIIAWLAVSVLGGHYAQLNQLLDGI
ncbi:MAG: type II secretion system F family protein [Verrucomicrobiales bacterium]|jgi:type IV pilus assembly protein PilC|nr:type II secretion system F family protein [Verrucomicrobiales bacterium]